MRTLLARRAQRRAPIRARWLIIVLAMGVLVPATPASAHVVYGESVVAQGQGACEYAYSEISHGDGSGYAQIAMQTRSLSPSWLPCGARDPNWVFQHAMLGIIYFWSSAGQWEPCFGSEWMIQNDKQSSWRSWSGLAWQCGTGWYTTDGYLYFRTGSNAEWLGGYQPSGHGDVYYHWANGFTRTY